ncbi:MAG: DUF3027 domain-containing protein, partial [Streptomycetaceae bacterium]
MAKKSLFKKAKSAPAASATFDATDLARNAIIDELHGASEIGGFVSVEFD